MSSVVCQNFQSCFEPRTLGLQVSSNQLAFLCDMRSPTVSESRFSTEQPHNYYSHGSSNNNSTYKQKTTSSDSWSSIESISKVDQADDEKKERSPYIHPLVKRSSSALSGKSLELCTETLGCETGTNVDDDNVNFPDSPRSVESCGSPARKRSNSQQLAMHEKVITSPRRSFPPPLTSISHSSDCNVQFRPHREGGRLVIKAISVATSPTCFQAERVNGRLRLLLKEQVFSEDQEQGEDEEVEDENYAAEEIDEAEITKDSNVSEETDGKGDVAGEMGIGNLHRHRRCKESGNKAELAKWDHFCVAT